MDSSCSLIDFFHKKLEGLQHNKINEYQQKSEMIIDAILGIKKAELYTSNFSISKNQIQKLEESFLLLEKDVPVQHIIGKTSFYNDEFLTPPGIFIPRPETELIVDCIKNDFKNTSKKTLLDIGCGSGCVGITIASLYKDFDVTAIDISDKAVTTANKNAKKLDVSNIQILKKDIFQMDTKKFDIIVSNPPYIGIDEVNKLDNSVKNHDPVKALSDNEDGLKFYKFFIKNVSQLLEIDGVMYFEIPNSEITHQIIDMINNNNNIEGIFFKDLEGNKRVVKLSIKQL
tara:strand:- start:1773 stop:2630 length:858 start_codon:yes stop_codon:yes gene_type:complete